MNIEYAIEKQHIDRRKITINKKHYYVIFDTGASDSFVCSGILPHLGNLEIKACNSSFRLINSTCLTITRYIIVQIQYENRNYDVKFYIIENLNSKEITIGNNMLKNMISKK